jgi:hypothetical protein
MKSADLLEETSAALGALLSSHALSLFGGLVLLLLLQSARLFWVRRAAARRVTAHRKLGAAGEKRARALLKKEGFRIESEQDAGTYTLLVDGRQQTVRLRADFLVERRGRVFVAEVKSGIESVKVTGRGTRRQLLEYLFAFEVDGILLVDMQTDSIREVVFPAIKGQ